MDTIQKDDGVALAAWKAPFGGNQIDGRLRFGAFLVAYLLIGGLTLAQWA